MVSYYQISSIEVLVKISPYYIVNTIAYYEMSTDYHFSSLAYCCILIFGQILIKLETLAINPKSSLKTEKSAG